MLIVLLHKMLSLRPAERPSAEESLVEMESWKSITSSTTLTQNALPPIEIPQACRQSLRHCQKHHVSGDLLNDKSKGEAKKKQKIQNGGNANLKMVAIDEASNNVDGRNTDDEVA
jgi:hypothetical protein